ncbi:hypothetical protein A3C96_02565 [Candidatus Uhrbacteria bacterium RIFCSPHIGHO2_02_FULL_60_10]|uniref:DUF4134 domain-containing protein n=1 Tax=Candidatus Uhrbacteria bacterium RIFCSPHIGHO2_02_FULL_60_10 TaxID=1802392 RepID=A0A1F7U2S2_9BACT|nr:MAG: hypothetical protein A3C96_02565 [Candidatus Uhrbacteria bacterium RIFCSPHIGHO2_02_FULL_60_10]
MNKSIIPKIIAGALAFVPTAVLAQNTTTGGFTGARNGMRNLSQKIGINTTTNLTDMVGNLIGAVLGLLGLILVLFIIYAGYLWMTAQGDPKKVDEAKAIIKNCIIGLVIIAAAFAISDWVFQNLLGAA